MVKWRGVFLSLFLKYTKKGYFDRIEVSSSSSPFKARSWIYFQLDLELDFNSYLIHWFKNLFPLSDLFFISSYFHKHSPNSSQTFQSFKISLIFLQKSFKIRITIFSCQISCCFTLQTWKGMKELEIDLTFLFLKNGLALASINTFTFSILVWLFLTASIRGVYPF